MSESQLKLKAAMRPRPITWLRHSVLLILTFITATIAGVLVPFGIINFGPEKEPQSLSEFVGLIPSLPWAYGSLVLSTIDQLYHNQEVLLYGISFSASLLFILIAHEAGHYIACRIHGVDATLPYFIPTPPLLGPAGTFGAFIRIVSPVPSKKAVFDIGVAGPIAGFVAILPIALLMILTLETAPRPWPAAETSTEVIFADPLLTHVFAYFASVDLGAPIFPNPFYFAVWVGLLITALNLMPSGQLDGGHVVYSVFGERVHDWTGKIAFVVVMILAVMGIIIYNSPAGIIFAVLLGFMLKVHHPEPPDKTPLDAKRIAVAILVLAIFILSFVPFPIRLPDSLF